MGRECRLDTINKSREIDNVRELLAARAEIDRCPSLNDGQVGELIKPKGTETASVRLKKMT